MMVEKEIYSDRSARQPDPQRDKGQFIVLFVVAVSYQASEKNCPSVTSPLGYASPNGWTRLKRCDLAIRANNTTPLFGGNAD